MNKMKNTDNYKNGQCPKGKKNKLKDNKKWFITILLLIMKVWIKSFSNILI